jgi:RHS repeat-associated protein
MHLATITGLYDFMFREYNPVHGRWISPAPAGMAAADPTNPQTWNLYAYVGNSPLDMIDPIGMRGRIGRGTMVASAPRNTARGNVVGRLSRHSRFQAAVEAVADGQVRLTHPRLELHPLGVHGPTANPWGFQPAWACRS